MRLMNILAVAGALLLPQSASAQVQFDQPSPASPASEAAEDHVIADINPANDCEKDAPTTTIAQIVRNLDRFAGQCVQISGFVDGWLIHEDAAERGQPTFAHLGTYPQRATYLFDDGVSRVSVAGKVDTCEARFKEPGVFMILGYCHHYSGAFIRVTRIERINADR